MRRSLAMVALLGLAGVGCEASVCGAGLVEAGQRCEAEVIVKQCSERCNATAHEACDTSAEEPVCVCAPGYEGNPCQWVGVLEDSGFEDPEAWSKTNGATVLPFERGPIDDGVAFLAPSVVCNGGGVSQTVEMPSYEAGEPFVAEVTYRAREVLGMSVGFNRAWTELPATSGDEWSTERVCLGGDSEYKRPFLASTSLRIRAFCRTARWA